MANGQYKLIKDNGTTLDEKTVLAESGMCLGFDAGLDPVMISPSGEGSTVATASEVDAGTNDSKFVSPLALAGSKYSKFEVSATEPASPVEGMLWIDTSPLNYYDYISFEFRDLVPDVAQIYDLDIYANAAYTIVSAFLETDDGTISLVNIRKNGTAFGSDKTIDSTVDEFAVSGSVSVGDRITLTTQSTYTGSPSLIRGKLVILKT